MNSESLSVFKAGGGFVFLKDILERVLKGQKFRLECGHHVSFGSNLGNDITVINGKEFKIICSLCGH